MIFGEANIEQAKAQFPKGSEVKFKHLPGGGLYILTEPFYFKRDVWITVSIDHLSISNYPVNLLCPIEEQE